MVGWNPLEWSTTLNLRVVGVIFFAFFIYTETLAITEFSMVDPIISLSAMGRGLFLLVLALYFWIASNNTIILSHKKKEGDE